MTGVILDGIRVLDLTTIVAGPYATMILGDLGAEVIKVEAPGGDGYRSAPPGRHAGMGAPFMGVNRSKRSLALDLKADGAVDVLVRLARWADVAVHNVRPSAARRLGIDSAALRQVNPDLIHCTTTGFGSAGDDADLPAYDDIVQARAGLATLLAGTDGEPRLAPTLLVDKLTGMQVANSILAALLQRERTGHAATIEVSMFETIAAFLLVEHMGGRGFEPHIGPAGYNRVLSADRRPYRTADGWIVVLPYTTRHWQDFMAMAAPPVWPDCACPGCATVPTATGGPTLMSGRRGSMSCTPSSPRPSRQTPPRRGWPGCGRQTSPQAPWPTWKTSSTTGT